MCDPLLDWQEIPESEALELLEKECVKWGGENWKDAKIKECLILPTKGDNQGAYKANIRTNRIWNRNGCIFKDGVWAEKLEEPEIKEGQMIWVKNTDQEGWFYEKYISFDGEEIATTCADVEWRYDEYSILNPYPDSIEARAVELLRKHKKVNSTGKLIAFCKERDEFLQEIDIHE